MIYIVRMNCLLSTVPRPSEIEKQSTNEAIHFLLFEIIPIPHYIRTYGGPEKITSKESGKIKSVFMDIRCVK